MTSHVDGLARVFLITAQVNPEVDQPVGTNADPRELAQRVVEYLDALHYFLQFDVRGRLPAFGSMGSDPFRVPLPTFRPKHVEDGTEFVGRVSGESNDGPQGRAIWYVDGLSEAVYMTDRSGARIGTYGELIKVVVADALDCPAELAKALVRAGKNGPTYAKALCALGGRSFMNALAAGDKSSQTLHQRLINMATMPNDTLGLLCERYDALKNPRMSVKTAIDPPNGDAMRVVGARVPNGLGAEL